jgi:hypothetical protein
MEMSLILLFGVLVVAALVVVGVVLVAENLRKK